MILELHSLISKKTAYNNKSIIRAACYIFTFYIKAKVIDSSRVSEVFLNLYKGNQVLMILIPNYKLIFLL